MEPQPPQSVGINFLTRQHMGQFFVLVLLGASLYGTFKIVVPYIHPIVLAALLTYLFHPCHDWLLKKSGNRRNVAAGMATLLVALVVILPLVLFAAALATRAQETVDSVRQMVERWEKAQAEREAREAAEGGEDGQGADAEGADGEHREAEDAEAPPVGVDRPPEPPDAVPTSPGAPGAVPTSPAEEFIFEQQVRRLLPQQAVESMVAWKEWLAPDLDITPTALREWIIENWQAPTTQIFEGAAKGIGVVFNIVISFLMMLFVMFYFFRDGGRIVRYVLELCPLPDEQEELLVDRVKAVSKAAVFGTLATAVTQAALAMIGFAISGIPWFFWGVMVGVSSLIPVVGTGIITIPACAYLFLSGEIVWGLFLTVWSLAIVGGSDNLLRPYYMHGGTGMSELILFFAIIGGITQFGLLGLIYGPLVVGVCAVLLFIYKLEIGESKSNTVRPVTATSAAPPAASADAGSEAGAGRTAEPAEEIPEVRPRKTPQADDDAPVEPPTDEDD